VTERLHGRVSFMQRVPLRNGVAFAQRLSPVEVCLHG